MNPIDLSAANKFEIRGRQIWLDFGDYEYVATLPKGAKITLWKRKTGATINIGSFTKINVSVTGPLADITALYRTLSA